MSGGAGTIEHRFVAYGERRVMVRRAGSGPPVVLLHESPRSSAAFIPMIEALAERFTVIAPDTPAMAAPILSSCTGRRSPTMPMRSRRWWTP